jgi:TPR repeat protein
VRWLLSSAALFCVAGAPLFADPALEAYQAGDYDTARAIWTERAERDDLDALYGLARMTFEGQGTEQDARGAERLLTRAARLGDPRARSCLALGQEAGGKGKKWLEREARAGNPMAQFYLGKRLESGRRAAYWLELAAHAGIAVSQARLGRIYIIGDGVPMDTERGERWLLAAAKNGSGESFLPLGEYYYVTAGSGADYVRAAAWFRKAAMQGDPMGRMRIAVMYHEGIGVDQDPVEAYAWLSLNEGLDENTRVMFDTLRHQLDSSLSEEEVARALHRASRIRAGFPKR